MKSGILSSSLSLRSNMTGEHHSIIHLFIQPRFAEHPPCELWLGPYLSARIDLNWPKRSHCCEFTVKTSRMCNTWKAKQEHTREHMWHEAQPNKIFQRPGREKNTPIKMEDKTFSWDFPGSPRGKLSLHATTTEPTCLNQREANAAKKTLSCM